MLLYEDITEKIVRAFYEVHNELGSGLLEKVYERALIIELKNQGLKVENQKPLKVFYKGNEVGDYFSDLVVEDKIIIEIKSSSGLVNENLSQLINYLKITKLKLGFLVNFGKNKVEFKRIAN